MISGVDLYHGNSMVDPNGFDFVFHKATQGTWFTDPACQVRLKLVRDAGKLAGMYHFMTTADPIHAQVEYFLEQGKPQRADILILDFEDDGSWDSITAIDLATMATQFMNQLSMEAEFNKVILYCNKDTYEHVVSPHGALRGDGLWISTSGVEPRFGQLFWQYASDTVDRDYGYFDSLADAKLWADQLSQKPPVSQQKLILSEG